MTPGTSYTVVAEDGPGCASPSSASFSNAAALPVPTAAISGNLSFCTGSSTVLTASGGNSYNWFNQSGTNISTSANATITQAGGYAVIVAIGTCLDTAVAMVTEISTLPVTITGNPSYCPGASTVLTVNAGAGATYNWSSGQTNAIINVTAGTYTVTATDPNSGCTGTASQVVTEDVAPTVVVTPVNSSVCPNDSVTLTASGAVTYSWGGSNNSASFAAGPGSYQVIGTDANGCSASATATVSANAAPTVAITGVLQYCTGGNTTITATGGTSYVWSTTETTPSITVTQGSYDVTGTDANGCTATATAQVTEASSLLVSITPAADTVCPGATTTLTATGGTSYTWSEGTVTDNIAAAAAGTYTVTATNGACSGTATAVVSQHTVTGISIADVTICSDSIATLDAGSGYANYAWSNNETTQSISTNAAGAYTVTATDANTCTATASATVTTQACNVPPDFKVFVPNAFTPNGDGNNEKFQIFISDVVFAEIKVFNRIGEKIFETNNIFDYWDGSYKGKPCNPGIYIYDVNVIGSNGKNARYNGSVALIR
jgi:gliding motility-associated-like protein